MRVSWRAGMAVWLLAGITAGYAQAPATPTQANAPPATAAEAPQRTYGISLLGAPPFLPDFKFFPYVTRTRQRAVRSRSATSAPSTVSTRSSSAAPRPPTSSASGTP